MAEDSAELAELKKQTRMMAQWEGSKAIFAGLMFGVFVGVMLMGMTANTSLLPVTLFAPVVFPILFAWISYRAAMDDALGVTEKPTAAKLTRLPRAPIPRPTSSTTGAESFAAKWIAAALAVGFIATFVMAIAIPLILAHH